MKLHMPKEYRQIEWDDQLADDCRQLVRLAVAKTWIGSMIGRPFRW